METLIYTGTYKVVKVFRKSYRHKLLRKNLTLEEAKRVVKSYPNSNTSMVVFTKQFSASKYYKTVETVETVLDMAVNGKLTGKEFNKLIGYKS